MRQIDSPYAACDASGGAPPARVLAFTGPPKGTGCPTPSPQALAQVRAQLQEARSSLNSHADSLSPSDFESLRAKLDAADAALERYIQLADLGRTRKRVEKPLYIAGGTLLLDDTTGIGVADDWILPLIGVALLVTRLATQGPAPTATLDDAWKDFITKAQAVGQGAQALPQARTQRRHPNQTCEDTVLDDLQAKKNQACNSHGRWSCGPDVEKIGRKKERLLSCVELLRNLAIGEGCLAARRRVQEDCFNNNPDSTHEKAINDALTGVQECRDKAISRNCL